MSAMLQSRAHIAKSRISKKLFVVESNRLPKPRTGIIISGAGHLLVILSLVSTWPHLVPHSGDEAPVILVELVTIDDQTNIAPMTRELLPFPESVVARTGAAPPTPAESAPTFEMKLFPVKPPPPRVVEGSTKPAKFDGDGNATTPTSAPKDARLGEYDIEGVGDRTASTLSVLDALRNLIARCWSRTANSTRGPAAVIAFELYLNRDGSIARPPQLHQTSAADAAEDPSSQVEAIRRAIYTCAPYQLPSTKYRVWRHSVVVFDLTKMGQ